MVNSQSMQAGPRKALNPSSVAFREPWERCTHHWIEDRAAQHPEKPAVRFGSQELSYGELNGEANRCARYLRGLGVGPDIVVGVLMERSAALPVALLAVLKAGGAYLPLDVSWPEERLRFVLEDADVSIVLTDSGSGQLPEGFSGTTFCLDSHRNLLAEESTENPEPLAGPDDLAYVIYTSGSTGKPKGCMIPHKALGNRLLWMQEAYPLTDGDAVLQKTPYTFDVSVWEFFWPLIAGARLVLAKPEGHKSNAYLASVIREERITVCHFVPSMLRYFIRHPDAGRCDTLRHVFASGEALPYDLMEEFMACSQARLHNLYGPTEAAIDVTYWDCVRREERIVPIGRPISNIRIYILKSDLEPAKEGEEGELYIGGVGLARGYLNRPELTADRFVESPFAEAGTERLYRTGDCARRGADGEIEYLGRLDLQVKLRGNRIELEEIEAALREHASIEDAAVAVKEDDEGDPKLIAYVVARGSDALSDKDIRQHAKSKLPEYMVPNRIVGLASLPLSSHGKLARAELPWPVPEERPYAGQHASRDEAHGEAVGTGQDPTRTPDSAQARRQIREQAAREMSDYFKNKLALREVDGDSDLFDLGATSLTMVQVVDNLHRSFGVEVPVEIFLENPTIDGIADYVGSVWTGTQMPAGEDAAVEEKIEAPEPNAAESVPSPLTIRLPAEHATTQDMGSDADARSGFGHRAVSLSRFGGMLSLLRRADINGAAKYLYPSAGGLYSVQTYVYVANRAVEGIEQGCYYYHPLEHALHAVTEKMPLDALAFREEDRRILREAGFALFLVARMDGIRPVYQDAAPILASLDAGYMSELLLSRQEDCGVRLLPAPGIRFGRLRSRFGLEPDHKFLFGLLGGSVPAPGTADNAGAAGGLADYDQATAASGADSDERTNADSEEKSFASFLQAGTADPLAGFGRVSAEKREEGDDAFRFRVAVPGHRIVPLPARKFPDWHYERRASRREYAERSATIDQIGKLLSLLRPSGEGHARRYAHAFPASLHTVEAYLYAKQGGIDGLAEGIYRYDPVRHALHLVNGQIDKPMKNGYTPFNRKHYQAAGFCLYLVGDPAPLRPVFGEDSAFYSLLEAGHIGQLLMERQAEIGIGLCPIGGIDFERVRSAFGLREGQAVLHSFTAGSLVDDIPRAADPARGEPEIAEASRPGAVRGLADADIAVVGMAGRYPGAADLDAYWEILKRGDACYGPLPESRAELWGLSAAHSSSANAYPVAGLLENIDSFDHLLFHISPPEARSMDPQERVLLEVTWECLEQAGYTAARLNRQCGKVGVFVGAMWTDYQNQRSRADVSSAEPALSLHSSIANRISYFFDFDGPSLAVNTSCSSALTAIHLACESLKRGECDAAIVGGINLMTDASHLDMLTKLNLLSQTGECRPFSIEADGWVAGEGAGVLLLRTLDSARRERDCIHGVIRGTAITHSGRTSRFGIPSADRQAASIRTALRNARMTPDEIDYVEAAVPGAGITDAAETDAIRKTFAGRVGSRLCVGSVKGVIGHLESASAMSQVMKTLLQFKHGQLSPVRRAEPFNPLIRLQEAGCDIVCELRDWPDRQGFADTVRAPRRALVNTFGATGSGGHLVLEEYCLPVPVPSESAPASGSQPILLSAATKPQLAETASRLANYLSRHPDIPLGDIAFTLREGRVAHKERMAIVADSRDDLAVKLIGAIAGSPMPGSVFRGTAGAELEESGQREEESEAGRYCARWVRGETVEWPEQWHNGRTVPLPAYPFEKASHWIRRAEPAAPPTISPANPPTKAYDGKDPIDAEAVEQAERLLLETFSEASEIPVERLQATAELETYGISSLIIQKLHDRLKVRLGELPAAIFFEYRSLRELAVHLARHYADRIMQPNPAAGQAEAIELQDSREMKDSRQPMAAPKAVAAMSGSEDIAIIGASGMYPKARNLSELWDNLKRGVDAVTEIPDERWPYRLYYDERKAVPGKAYSKWGGFLDDIDKFDPLFFNISPREAERMDPQERLFLQTAWHAVEDAGYSRRLWKDRFQRNVGVFVGVMYAEYQLLNAADERLGILSPYGSIANRVSYALDCVGPSMAVDTLCSSSLTAIHLAMESIRRGECRAAIAGGVNLSLHPSKYIAHSQMTMSSTDGRCRSFGEGGDGFVPGEGVGAVLLKPLADAVRDRDPIYAVIKASSVNHGGRTNGYTVPNPAAHEALILEAIRKSGIDPSTIGCVEAHGTGTMLGDPIEIAGLARSFGAYTDEKQYCAIGSIKSNIGHLEGAAGIAGVTKALLQLKHKQLVPSLHAERLNPHIHFEDTPFYVQKELADWPRRRIPGEQSAEAPRRICVSSFGAGGSNAHLILEEFEPLTDPDKAGGKARGPFLFVLSAKKEARLREAAESMREWLLRNKTADTDPSTVAYTLQIGREPMEKRLAVVADSLDDFERKLARYAENDGAGVPGLYRGTASGKLPASSADGRSESDWEPIESSDPDKLAEMWVGGREIDWLALYGDRQPGRISLPGYPFAKERYWIRLPDQPRNGLHAAEPARAAEDDSASDPLASAAEEPSVPQEPAVYEEMWVREDLPSVPSISNAPIRRLACVLSNPELQRVAADGFATLAPDMAVDFIVAGKRDGNGTNPYAESIRRFRDVIGAIDAVLYLEELGEADGMGEYERLVALVQALASEKVHPRALLLAGAYRDERERCYRESWIGMERTLKNILPGTSAAVILKPWNGKRAESEIESWLAVLLSELQAGPVRTASYHGDGRHVAQVHPITVGRDTLKLRTGGTYLITGGLGELGYRVARSWAERGINLVLTGRSPLTEEGRARTAALEAAGSRVLYLQADAAHPASMRRALERAEESFGTVHGVVHAAGTMDNRSLLVKSADDFRQALRAKVAGTVTLDELLKPERLDFICYFASASAVFGDFGSCDYAVGNRFQTAYAAYLNRRLREGGQDAKAYAIQWPAWREGGMGAGEEQKLAMYLKASGQRMLETEEGIALLDRLLVREGGQPLIAAGGRATQEFKGGYAKEEKREAVPSVPLLTTDGHAPEADLNLEEAVEANLKKDIGRILRIAEEELDAEVNLSEFGFDSITLAELAASLSSRYGIEASPTIFYTHTTIRKLGRYLIREHSDAITKHYRVADVGPAGEASSVRGKAAARVAGGRKGFRFGKLSHPPVAEPIAVIGMSGRFPGAADAERLWRQLLDEKSAISEFPRERLFGRETADTGGGSLRTEDRVGGFLEGYDCFDPLFFSLSPKEAEAMDPQQRLFLEESWHALEDAGYMGERIRGRRCGVFAGAEESQYGELSMGRGQSNSNQNAALPARIAYELDLKGPNMSITAACSSGLVAIHQACLALRQGDCEMALAGGVSLTLAPIVYTGLSRSGMLSPDGRSYVFDRRANGLVPGEAVAVVVLKPLSKAIKDKDRIYGCIRASGVNYNGRSNGFASPNPISQAELLNGIYGKHDIDPGQIGYLMTHSVGSKLGDAMEIEALTASFARRTLRKGYCAVGSVKPLIGHTFAASGVVSLMVLLQAMKNRTILKLPGYQFGNEYIDWPSTPFYVPDTPRPWEAEPGQRRVGAVSTTGVSGTNAHLVVEEYIPADDGAEFNEPSAKAGESELIVLSAKNEERLLVHAERLLGYLREERAEEAGLGDIAYTLRTGRDEMKSRLAIVASSKQELAAKLTTALQSFRNGSKLTEPGVYAGTATEAKENAVKDIPSFGVSADSLETMARRWTEGTSAPWKGMELSGRKGRIISLPTYPFAPRRCWIEAHQDPGVPRHPLADSRFENKAAELYAYNALDKSTEFREEYLTFCPFEIKVPGFSMSRVFLDPDRYKTHADLMRDKQIEMRQVLFAGIDFRRIGCVLDIGCGHGTDVIQMATLYPHLQAHGCTITKAQAELGNNRIEGLGLAGRAAIYHRDSSKDPFPGRYELAIGIEVACHIRDKDGLFANVSRHLRNGGQVLLMDFISNLKGRIEDPNLEIHIATGDDWLASLSSHGLVIEEMIDVSPQIANFLYDPDIESNISHLPEVARNALRNFANCSVSLERGWISYCLFKLRKDDRLAHREIAALNARRMSDRTPYAQVLDRMRRSGSATYPPGRDLVIKM